MPPHASVSGCKRRATGDLDQPNDVLDVDELSGKGELTHRYSVAKDLATLDSHCSVLLRH